jgi:hypothetical protein
MSKYKVIQTEFRNLESLTKAIEDVLGSDAQHVAIDPKHASLHLYGYLGDQRPELASIRIPREVVNRFSGGCSNDIGFAWDGSRYTAIVSEYDSGKPGSQAMLNQIRQRYAYHEIARQARAKGYTLRETRLADGTITLQLTHR